MLKVAEKTLTVTLPNTAVLYLRTYKKTSDKMKYVINTPGGIMQYDVPIMKVRVYALNEIFKKSLLLLIPFFIFHMRFLIAGSTSAGEICPPVLPVLYYLCGDGNKITKKGRPTIGAVEMQ